MKRFLLSLFFVGLLLYLAVVVRPRLESSRDIKVGAEARNPWNHLRVNKDREQFHFAVVSDRTGGARPGVFERAIEQLNLLQPEFVLSVGDLIEGSKKSEHVNPQWEEFDGLISRLQMPFFYVAGNHDIMDEYMTRRWGEKFGRSYYHFMYQDVLFLMLNTEDPPNWPGGHLSDEQLEYARGALQQTNQRWTFVLMHKPMWDDKRKTKGWPELEQALGDRPYTVIAGHIHKYKKEMRNGRLHLTLATTGGSSKLRGWQAGEFDHILWVTMKKDGPVLANLMQDGITDLELTPMPPPAPPKGEGVKKGKP